MHEMRKKVTLSELTRKECENTRIKDDVNEQAAAAAAAASSAISNAVKRRDHRNAIQNVKWFL